MLRVGGVAATPTPVNLELRVAGLSGAPASSRSARLNQPSAATSLPSEVACSTRATALSPRPHGRRPHGGTLHRLLAAERSPRRSHTGTRALAPGRRELRRCAPPRGQLRTARVRRRTHPVRAQRDRNECQARSSPNHVPMVPQERNSPRVMNRQMHAFKPIFPSSPRKTPAA